MTLRRLALTMILLMLSIPVVVIGGQESTGLKTLNKQTGAPLQQAGAMFSEDSLKVLLVNLSGREVRQVTLGLVMEDESSHKILGTRTGRACVAKVATDGFLVTTEKHAGYEAAASYFREHGICRTAVTVGVTEVLFADATEWNYPLEAKGHFEEQPDESISTRIRALREKQFPNKDVSWAFLGPGVQGKISTCQN
jgi:hypothetical protein